jgi:hypothetical protein
MISVKVHRGRGEGGDPWRGHDKFVTSFVNTTIGKRFFHRCGRSVLSSQRNDFHEGTQEGVFYTHPLSVPKKLRKSWFTFPGTKIFHFVLSTQTSVLKTKNLNCVEMLLFIINVCGISQRLGVAVPITNGPVCMCE